MDDNYMKNLDSVGVHDALDRALNRVMREGAGGAPGIKAAKSAETHDATRIGKFYSSVFPDYLADFYGHPKGVIATQPLIDLTNVDVAAVRSRSDVEAWVKKNGRASFYPPYQSGMIACRDGEVFFYQVDPKSMTLHAVVAFSWALSCAVSRELACLDRKEMKISDLYERHPQWHSLICASPHIPMNQIKLELDSIESGSLNPQTLVESNFNIGVCHQSVIEMIREGAEQEDIKRWEIQSGLKADTFPWKEITAQIIVPAYVRRLEPCTEGIVELEELRSSSESDLRHAVSLTQAVDLLLSLGVVNYCLARRRRPVQERPCVGLTQQSLTFASDRQAQKKASRGMKEYEFDNIRVVSTGKPGRVTESNREGTYRRQIRNCKDGAWLVEGFMRNQKACTRHYPQPDGTVKTIRYSEKHTYVDPYTKQFRTSVGAKPSVDELRNRRDSRKITEVRDEGGGEDPCIGLSPVRS